MKVRAVGTICAVGVVYYVSTSVLIAYNHIITHDGGLCVMSTPLLVTSSHQSEMRSERS
jgi:hypothetical protein